MLPAEHRLRRRVEFAAAVRSGRRAARATLVVHLVSPLVSPDDRTGSTRMPAMYPSDSEACPPARAGFVVSKAVGGSVVRHRVTRQLRHLVAPRLVDLPAGSILVVRALAPAATAGSDRLAADLDSALGQAQHPRAPGGVLS